jgi:alpha-tubulin suppressor-like RCC1 family protein
MYHTACITETGTVVTWGRNAEVFHNLKSKSYSFKNQLGFPKVNYCEPVNCPSLPFQDSHATKVSCGKYHTTILDGTFTT